MTSLEPAPKSATHDWCSLTARRPTLTTGRRLNHSNTSLGYSAPEMYRNYEGRLLAIIQASTRLFLRKIACPNHILSNLPCMEPEHCCGSMHGTQGCFKHGAQKMESHGLQNRKRVPMIIQAVGMIPVFSVYSPSQVNRIWRFGGILNLGELHILSTKRGL